MVVYKRMERGWPDECYLVAPKFPISVRLCNGLLNMGVKSWEDITGLTKRKFLCQKNLGVKSWREFEEIRAEIVAEKGTLCT
jgi:hypothetical protein